MLELSVNVTLVEDVTDGDRVVLGETVDDIVVLEVIEGEEVALTVTLGDTDVDGVTLHVNE